MIQGSKEWLKYRSTRVGSSDISVLLGINPFKSLRELYLEKTGMIQPEDISEKKAVKKGVRLEPVARELMGNLHKCQYETAVYTDDLNEKFIYSSDGVCEKDKSIIEIKCMGLPNHTKVVQSKQILDYYYPQCQWGLMISKMDVCHFVSYNEDHENKLIVISCYPDNHQFELMKSRAELFLNAVENKDWASIAHW